MQCSSAGPDECGSGQIAPTFPRPFSNISTSSSSELPVPGRGHGLTSDFRDMGRWVQIISDLHCRLPFEPGRHHQQNYPLPDLITNIAIGSRQQVSHTTSYKLRLHRRMWLYTILAFTFLEAVLAQICSPFHVIRY